jgi:HSP20 family protein
MTSITREAPAAAPGRELATMRNRIRRFFEEPFGLDLQLMPEFARRREAMRWAPAVEASETSTEYVITAELPGVSLENVEVSVVDGVLALRGSKEEESRSEDKERAWHLWEREYGAFERTFRFPLEVDDAKVSAEFTNGVLTVRVPKSKEARSAARTVPIAKKP